MGRTDFGHQPQAERGLKAVALTPILSRRLGTRWVSRWRRSLLIASRFGASRRVTDFVRSIVERLTTRLAGAPYLDRVDRPVAAAFASTTNSTFRIGLMASPRFELTVIRPGWRVVETHSPGGLVTIRPRGGERAVRSTALPPARPACRVLPPVPVRESVVERLLTRRERVDVAVARSALPAPAVRSESRQSPTPVSRLPREELPVVTRRGWTPQTDDGVAMTRAKSGSSRQTRPVASAAQTIPDADVERLTDRVVRSIDRRIAAHREQFGGVR